MGTVYNLGGVVSRCTGGETRGGLSRVYVRRTGASVYPSVIVSTVSL